VGIFGAGAQYERVFNDKLSVGAGLYYYWLAGSTFGIEANVRYYPFSGRIQGLFFDAGAGYGTHWGVETYEYTDYWGKYTTEEYSTTKGFLLRPGVGWKFDVGKPGRFFVEPHIGIPIVLGKQSPVTWGWGGEVVSKFGVGVGFIMQVALGYAF
jgi:hypothetical protein